MEPLHGEFITIPVVDWSWTWSQVANWDGLSCSDQIITVMLIWGWTLIFGDQLVICHCDMSMLGIHNEVWAWIYNMSPATEHQEPNARLEDSWYSGPPPQKKKKLWSSPEDSLSGETSQLLPLVACANLINDWRSPLCMCCFSWHLTGLWAGWGTLVVVCWEGNNAEWLYKVINISTHSKCNCNSDCTVWSASEKKRKSVHAVYLSLQLWMFILSTKNSGTSKLLKPSMHRWLCAS